MANLAKMTIRRVKKVLAWVLALGVLALMAAGVLYVAQVI